MADNISKLFATDIGKKIYQDAERAIKDFSIGDLLKKGILVGLSGGADSVMLLYFLIEFRKNNFDFKIAAAHFNHQIREEAGVDEAFSKSLCENLDIEFIALTADVPMLASKEKIGVEEAARKARYSAFADIISGRDDISSIAVAHNATDNLETILFNMMRGCGSRGASGIKPVRDNILRPLIYASSSEIREALSAAKIPFVFDKTNNDTDYTRNHIRHNVLPHFSRITPSPENAITRFAANIRCDDEFIDSIAAQYDTSQPVARETLLPLHRAVLARVIRNMCASVTDKIPETHHINKIKALLSTSNFSVSLPGDISFVCERDMCSIKAVSLVDNDFLLPLSFGENDFPAYSAKIFLLEDVTRKTYSNVYIFSISASIPRDIIKGEIYVRNRRDGDVYRQGGHTKKVKRILCDAKIPPSLRSRIPIICDSEGILWIPGFPPRDYDKGITSKRVTIGIEITDANSAFGFYIHKKSEC